MAKKWSGLKKRLVLDIGASAVRICELTRTKTGLQVSRYVQREYNSDPAMDEQQRRELRVLALKEALKAAKIKSRKAIFCVPGQSVFTRCRTLPPVPDYKVAQIVRYEIQQQIPFGLDQIAMDYQVLNRTEQGGIDVMMAAIKVEVVEKHLDVLEAAKLSVSSVDVSPLAAYNWMKCQGEFGEAADCVALIDLGAATTDIVIERVNQFRFTRPLNLGGNDISRALAEAFNMDFVSDERIKRERGFAPTGDPQRDGRGGEVIGGVLQRLVTEIMRSFSYFRSLPGGGQVNRVLLTGGGACLKNLAPYLRNQMGMDVRIAQSLARLDIKAEAEDIKKCPEQASVVLGMALRASDTVPLDINLIPPRILESARRREQVVYWALSICVLIAVFASMIPAAANQNRQVRQRIEELKSAIRAYDPELVQRIRAGAPVPESELKMQLEARRHQLQQLEGQLTILDDSRTHRRFWIDEISLVNDARPILGQMWFSSIETTPMAEEAAAGVPPAAPAPMDQEGGGFMLGGARGVGLGLAGSGFRYGPGFPGIFPQGALGTQGVGRGALTLGDQEPGAFGGGLAVSGGRPAASGGGPAASGEGVVIPRPSGLLIQGYAESDEIINQYREEIARAVRPLPNNWFVSVEKVNFSEASVQRVSWETLYNAPTDASFAGGRPVGNPPRPGESPLFSFTIEVKLRYTRERPAAAAPELAGGAGT